MGTIHLPPDFNEFFQWFQRHNVEYHLKRNKQAAARAKDFADLEELR